MYKLTTAITKHNHYLRLAFGVFLVLFLACKTIVPVFAIARAEDKEVPVAAEQEENKPVKINTPENDPEFNFIPEHGFDHVQWFTAIEHLTHYTNTYRSSYYHQITVPPPDVDLQFAV